MWFPLGFRTLIAKRNLKDDSCDIYVSDFIHIWHAFMTYNDLLLVSKTMNPLFEASVEKLKDIVFKLLEDVKVKKDIIEENKNILIKLESNIMRVRFQFQILLSLGNEEMFYNELTLPLLHLLLKTQSREKKLIDIIKSKDAEIKDYKQEYGNRSDFMATEPFSEKKFDSQESVADSFLDFSPILDCISYKLLSEETVSQIKQEEQLLKGKLNRKDFIEKNIKKKKVFQDKNLNPDKGSKPCLLLDNKIIKKIKKGNGEFKIKL